MQKLWSRVAQSGVSCRCPQCVHSVRAVGRRATTSAAPWTPRYFTTSTLLYTTLFAAAATVDGARKRERREQWDDAISGLKKELATLDESKELRPGLQEDAASLRQDAQPETTHPDRNGQQDWTRFEPLSFLDTTGCDRDPMSFIGREGNVKWPEHTGPPVEFHQLPPQSIHAYGYAKRRNLGIEFSPKKIEACELVMEILLLQLAASLNSKSQRTRRQRREATSQMSEELATILFQPPEAIESMIKARSLVLASHHWLDPDLNGRRDRKGLVNFCNYKPNEDGRIIESIAYTNEKLENAFTSFHRGDCALSSLIGQIASVLSSSRAPPTVNTFNTLLVGLSEHEHLRHLVDFVVDGLREAHIRPNEVTLETALRCYTRTNNAKEFVKFIDLMRGKYGGLMVAKVKHIRADKPSAQRLEWKNGIEGGKVIQLPHPSPNVFAALLEGVIRFSGLDAAISMHELMAQKGWGLGMHGYTLLLQEALYTKRWAEGLSAWQYLMLLDRRGKNRPKGQQERVGRHAILLMLQLCTVCGQAETKRAVHKVARERGLSKDSLESGWRFVVKNSEKELAKRAERQTSTPHDTDITVRSTAEALITESIAGGVQSKLDAMDEFTQDDMLEGRAQSEQSKWVIPRIWFFNNTEARKALRAVSNPIDQAGMLHAGSEEEASTPGKVPMFEDQQDIDRVSTAGKFAPFEQRPDHASISTSGRFMPFDHGQDYDSISTPGRFMPLELGQHLDSTSTPGRFMPFEQRHNSNTASMSAKIGPLGLGNG